MSHHNALIEVTCDYCDEDFDAPRSMKGGLANCPACNRATKVTGGAEPLFWVIVAASTVGGLLMVGYVTWTLGWVVGVPLFVFLLLIGGIALLTS